MTNVIEIQVRADDKASSDFAKDSKKLVDTASKAGDEAGKEFSKEFADSLKTGSKDAESEGGKAGEGYGKAYVDGTNGVMRGGFGVIKQQLADVEADSGTAGKNAGKKLADGVEDGAKGSNVRGSFKGEFSAVENEAATSGRSAGKALGEGVEEGAKSGKAGIRSSFAGLGDDLKDSLIDAGQDGGAGIIEGLTSAVGGKAGLVGAGLGGMLVTGIMEGMSRSDMAAVWGASNGLSGADAKKAGSIAGKLYSQGLGESVEANLDVASDVVTQLQVPVNSVDFEPILKKAAVLQKVFGVDTTEALRAVGQMVKTGMVPDINTGLDVLTAGLQNGNDQAGDLLETFGEYSTQFRKLGLSGQDAMLLISQGLQGGARDADIVADALKELSIRAVDGSKTTTDAYKSLGLNAQQTAEAFAHGGESARGALDDVLNRLIAIKDPVEQNRIGVELFGTQWEDMGAAVNALDLTPAVNQFQNVKGKLDEVGATVQGTFDQQLRAGLGTARDLFTDFTSGASDGMSSTTTDILSSFSLWAIGAWNAAGQMLSAGGSAERAARGVSGSIAGIPLWHSTSIAVDPGNSWSVINNVQSWLNGLKSKSVSVNVGITGAQAAISAFFPGWAHGGIVGQAATGGPRSNQVLVGEHGAEIVDLAPGSMVHPAGQTKTMLKDWFRGRGYAGGGVVQAAQEMLNQVSSGGQFFEDFSFHGNSDLVSQYNDQIASQYYPTGGDFNANSGPDIERFLQNFIASNTPAPKAGTSTAGFKTNRQNSGASGGDGRMVLELRSGGSKMDDLLVELIRKAVRNQGGDVQVVLGT